MREPVMAGDGYYNRHSELQAVSATQADGVLARALEAVAIPPGVITVADFGASQGHNSLRQLAMAVDRLGGRAGPERDIMVVHTDLPQNDFTSLFTTLAHDPGSYRHGRPHVFAGAIGQSFYERLLPARHLAFGWSAFALHWLSALPKPLRAHIWPICAAADEAGALAEVAALDWRMFLTNRAEELVPGGQLVLVVGALNQAGASGLEPMMDLANRLLAALVAEGRLDARAYHQMNITARPRRRDEFTAPFEQGVLPDLVLEELVIADTPNAAMLRWQQTGDAAVFAADITAFFLAAFGPCLFGENEALRETFSARFTTAIAEAPAAIARPLATATLRIRRR
jgi:hypothetical protein